MNGLRDKIVSMNNLRDKIAEILRYEHSHTLSILNPAMAGIQVYYPIADAILDIEIEQKCDNCLNGFTFDTLGSGICDVCCPKCNGTDKVKVKLREMLK